MSLFFLFSVDFSLFFFFFFQKNLKPKHVSVTGKFSFWRRDMWSRKIKVNGKSFSLSLNIGWRITSITKFQNLFNLVFWMFWNETFLKFFLRTTENVFFIFKSSKSLKKFTDISLRALYKNKKISDESWIHKTLMDGQRALDIIYFSSLVSYMFWCSLCVFLTIKMYVTNEINQVRKGKRWHFRSSVQFFFWSIGNIQHWIMLRFMFLHFNFSITMGDRMRLLENIDEEA
jgi:hypothetical protein